ncbi:hypothetical protein AB0M36_09715 [Actinoplanes sp. NPDC051346]|uniref:hypothetical protein n=1 Tax=Actinoplanes sp. NPDC051346 TaxID=3155048 RepID=UPI003432742F
MLVTSRMPGTPVAAERYPSGLTTAGASPLMDAIRALWDYTERLNRYHDESVTHRP